MTPNPTTPGTDCDECPNCNSEDIEPHSSNEPRQLGMLWCPDCEREFWQEGSTWWMCGADGLVLKVSEAGDESSEPQLDDAYPDDYVHRKPLPAEHELDDAECHNCGEPWNGGEGWDERHHSGGPTIGEDWFYTCPGCGEEVFEVGI